MSKISMMFQIVSLLQTNYIITRSELAEILETSPRNIKAYIEALRMAGVPIEGITGRGGGYFLNERYEFKPPRLTSIEYSALLLAEDVLTERNGFLYEHEIRTAFSKIKAAQGEIVDDYNWSQIDEYIFTKGSMDISPQVKKVLAVIRQALQERRQIHIIYNNPTKKRTTSRIVDPYNLIYRDASWYVIGYCHLRGELRMFKFMRIQKIELLESGYRIPKDFSIKNYMGNTLGLINDGKEYNVEIRFFHPASTWVAEKLWLPTQRIIRQDDGSVIFKAKVNGLADVKKWVLGYGSLAQVLRPKKLIDQIRREIADMGNRYKG